jgi:hypothetical protein
MGSYLNPNQTIVQAGEVLARELTEKVGVEEAERIKRTLCLRLGEQTRSVEQQVYVATTLLGRTQDQTILFLTLIWLAEKQTTEETTAWMLSEIRQQRVGEFVQSAQQTARQS